METAAANCPQELTEVPMLRQTCCILLDLLHTVRPKYDWLDMLIFTCWVTKPDTEAFLPAGGVSGGGAR